MHAPKPGLSDPFPFWQEGQDVGYVGGARCSEQPPVFLSGHFDLYY